MTTQPAPAPAPAVRPDSPEDNHDGFHGHAEWPNICKKCKAEKDQAAADLEVEHDAELDRQTCILADQVGTALIHVVRAQDAIAKLVGPLYDVEFAEGMEGSDVIAGLAAAGRELRNVERLAMRRREYLLEQDRHAADAAEARRLAELVEGRRQHENAAHPQMTPAGCYARGHFPDVHNEPQPGDEGTCGAAVYANDPDRDVQCMLPPHGSDVPHSNRGQAADEDPDAWAFRA